MPKRASYLTIAIVVVAAGLFIRHKSAWFPAIVNLYLGDLLYAVVMFLAVSFVWPRQGRAVRAIAALLFCFAIEFSQLYQADWINAVRRTLPGKLVLGAGFLWSDLLAYSLGVIAAWTIDRIGRRSLTGSDAGQ